MAKATSTKEWQGAVAAFKGSYEQIVKNPQPMLLFVGVYTLATIISLVIQDKSSISEKDYQSYADILMLFFLVPLTAYGLAVADKKFVEVQDFLHFTGRQFLLVLGASLLAGLAIAGSALLLLVPIIWTIGWFAASSYAALDKGLRPVAALKESKRISEAHKGKVWGLVGVSILCAIAAGILGAIPYIGAAASAFVTVLATAAFATLYRWLQKNS